MARMTKKQMKKKKKALVLIGNKNTGMTQIVKFKNFKTARSFANKLPLSDDGDFIEVKED